MKRKWDDTTPIFPYYYHSKKGNPSPIGEGLTEMNPKGSSLTRHKGRGVWGEGGRRTVSPGGSHPVKPSTPLPPRTPTPWAWKDYTHGWIRRALRARARSTRVCNLYTIASVQKGSSPGLNPVPKKYTLKDNFAVTFDVTLQKSVPHS